MRIFGFKIGSLLAFIGCCITAFLFLIGIRSCNENSRLRDQLRISKQNLEISSAMVQYSQNELNQTVASKKSMQMSVDDLKSTNHNLYQEVSALRIKLKNLGHVTTTETEFVYVVDSIYIPGVSISPDFSKYRIVYADSNWVSIDQTVCIDTTTKRIYIDSLGIRISAKYQIVSETNYKGFWFWRKATGSTIHIKSDNPYIQITDIQSITFDK